MFNNLNEAMNNVVSNNVQLLNSTVEHKDYGKGKIIDTQMLTAKRADLYGLTIRIVVEFDTAIKVFNLKAVFEAKMLVFEKEDIVLNLLETLSEAENMRLQQLERQRSNLKAKETKDELESFNIGINL